MFYLLYFFSFLFISPPFLSWMPFFTSILILFYLHNQIPFLTYNLRCLSLCTDSNFYLIHNWVSFFACTIKYPFPHTIGFLYFVVLSTYIFKIYLYIYSKMSVHIPLHLFLSSYILKLLSSHTRSNLSSRRHFYIILRTHNSLSSHANFYVHN